MWLVARFLPTTLFSLRQSSATNAVAKTLLLPSPFCIKMALLDASFRVSGIETTRQRFDWIKTLSIRISPPAHAVVNNCFVKILRLRNQRFNSTFAMREYIAFNSNGRDETSAVLQLAFATSSLNGTQLKDLGALLYQINQLGKRGCFVQLIESPQEQNEIDDSFSQLFEGTALKMSGTLQAFDDMQEQATIEQIDVFSDLHVSRREIIRHTVPTIVSLQRGQSSRSFTAYKRG